MNKIAGFFKRLFNIPSYYIAIDPTTGKDYSCKVTFKYYPKTEVYEIVKIEQLTK